MEASGKEREPEGRLRAAPPWCRPLRGAQRVLPLWATPPPKKSAAQAVQEACHVISFLQPMRWSMALLRARGCSRSRAQAAVAARGRYCAQLTMMHALGLERNSQC